MDPQRGERKLATVLFADLVGSTALAGAEDPERTRARLDRFYDAMSEQIDGACGTLEKFVGDAVMAAFGVPWPRRTTPSERFTLPCGCSSASMSCSAVSLRFGSG